MRETFSLAEVDAGACSENCQRCPFWLLPLVLHLEETFQKVLVEEIRQITVGPWQADGIKCILPSLLSNNSVKS